LVFQQGDYILEDLGSSNGTFVNGKPVRDSQVLTDGDEISWAVKSSWYSASRKPGHIIPAR